MNAIPLQPPAQRFAAILEYLRRSIAARGHKGTMPRPLLFLLWSRLGRTIRRFAALAARINAGTLPKPRLRAPRPRRAPAKPPLRLPRGSAWLRGPVPEANIARSQLEYLLAQPDMQALLAASPTMGRILRPLCRMLGLKPPASLAPPNRPSPAPRPQAPRPAPRHPPPSSPPCSPEQTPGDGGSRDPPVASAHARCDPSATEWSDPNA